MTEKRLVNMEMEVKINRKHMKRMRKKVAGDLLDLHTHYDNIERSWRLVAFQSPAKIFKSILY